MRIGFIVLVLASLALVGLCGTALATSVYDYGDAPGYGAATHSNPSWQRLGLEWDSEASQKIVDSSDDGVFWSVDDGVSWGHEDILAGHAVKFRFDMYKLEWGRHIEEHLKVWIDWNQDKDFVDSGEGIFQVAWKFREENDNVPYDDSFAGISKSFFLDLVIPENVLLGETWLRARVVCNADNPNLDFMSPTGSYWQGEVEDWQLSIGHVPEPSTFLLMGIGLAVAATMRRKFKK